MAEKAAGAFKGREDHRRARELEEARKAGTIPAEKDEDGNEINPHIPQFMSQAPWYLGTEAPGLKHQKNLKEKKVVAIATDFVPRGRQLGAAATSFRKGACTNCGAMTHKMVDCVERPRKKGAKYTGKDIKPDEFVPDMAFDYAGKRDHWANYDASDHVGKLKQYEKEVEIRLKAKQREKMANVALKESDRAARRKAKRDEKSKKKRAEGGGDEGDGEEEADTDNDTDTDDDDDDDDAKEKDDEKHMIGQNVGANRNQGSAKMSVRNLRIREDTAKYLLNLDVNSAFYDPKTRSMRNNPLAGTDDALEHSMNFVRSTGDARSLAGLQLYQFEAYDKGQNLHLNADPTTVEVMNKMYREKKEKLKSSKANAILDKYGGQEHMEQLAPELLYAQTEQYVEYDRSGGVKRGGEKAVARSKYEEDVFANNHTAVWGSYFDRTTMRWGYADDLSSVRHSYGTGEAGKRARQMAMARQQAAGEEEEEEEAATGAAAASSALVGRGTASVAPATAMFGAAEDLPEVDEAKVKAAIKAQKKRESKEGVETESDDRKRKYNSGASYEVTAEEMEAHHRLKKRDTTGDMADPMANYKDDD